MVGWWGEGAATVRAAGGRDGAGDGAGDVQHVLGELQQPLPRREQGLVADQIQRQYILRNIRRGVDDVVGRRQPRITLRRVGIQQPEVLQALGIEWQERAEMLTRQRAELLARGL